VIKFGQKINTSNTDTRYFITSDLHFYHTGVLRFCPDTRPWSNVDDMNAALIEHWNSIVGVDDEVISLGDFSFKGREATEAIISQLNGNITWVAGNHCRKVLGAMGVPFYDYLEFRFNGVKLCMMHYPIKHWNECDHGSIALHGHLHDSPSGIEGRTMDVGWDAHGKILNLEDVVSELKQIEVVGRRNNG